MMSKENIYGGRDNLDYISYIKMSFIRKFVSTPFNEDGGVQLLNFKCIIYKFCRTIYLE